jgi:hypothetical protein
MGAPLARVNRHNRFDVPAAEDAWQLFMALEAVVLARVRSFGSGRFHGVLGYSVSHEGGTANYDSLPEARAASEGVPDRLKWISHRLQEDQGDEAIQAAVGEMPHVTDPAREEYWRRRLAWSEAHNREVGLSVHKGDPRKGSWVSLDVSGNEPNEVLGFIQDLTTAANGRASTLAHSAPAGPAGASTPTGFAGLWRLISTHPLSTAIIGTVVGGLLVAVMLALFT